MTASKSTVRLYTKESGWVALDDPSVPREFKQEAYDSITRSYTKLLEHLKVLPVPKTALQKAREIARAAHDREERRSSESSANAYKTWVAHEQPQNV